MTDFASHIRIFEVNPTDDFVDKRKIAVAAIAKQYEVRKTFNELYELADELVAAASPAGKLFGTTNSAVEVALKDASPAFVMQGHELEARTCALLAAVSYLENAGASDGAATKSDVLAFGLWSGLSFQKSPGRGKLDSLRMELLGLARDFALRSADTSRLRLLVTEAGFKPIALEGDQGIEKRWKEGPLRSIDALRRNAALDHEEINILWWILAEWSDLYKEKFSKMDSRLTPLVAAWELSQLLKRMPAEAHKHLIFRFVHGGESESLQDLIERIEPNLGPLKLAIQSNVQVRSYSHIFPLASAMTGHIPKIDGSKEVRTRVDWASRALMEFGMLHLSSLSNPIS